MNKTFIFILTIIGVVVGLLLTRQVFTNAPLKSNFPADEIAAKDDLFKDFLDEQSYLQSRIVFLREEIEKSESLIEDQSEFSNIEFLDELKETIGLTELRGEGMEILLDDSPFALRDGAEVSDIDLIQAADIRDLINIINATNATAVSVNNQRVISTSPISSVGTTILVNNFHIAPPFTISAVGDSDLILERIKNDNLLSSFFDRVAKQNLVLQISVKEWVTVPAYNGDLKSEYINLIE